MFLSLVRERDPSEARVALTPEGVHGLVEAGHEVVVETEAGQRSGFLDSDYRAAGAQIAFSDFEAVRLSQVLVKVQAPTDQELELITPDSTLVSFLHLAARKQGLLQRLIGSGSTAVALELIENQGRRPVMDPLSAMGARIAMNLVQHHLTRSGGGLGRLIAGSPGVPPVRLVVLGGGVAGVAAARAAQAQGAQVAIVELDATRLMVLHEQLSGVVTVGASASNLSHYLQWADVVVGAVGRRGLPAPKVLTTARMRSMRSGSLFVDLSIDEGGCAETSRPNPQVYEAQGVRHLCVPNLASLVAQTASEALSIGTMPLLMALGHGMRRAVEKRPELLAATQVFEGTLCCSRVAKLHGGQAEDLKGLLG
jgi:alanine dehydrogenase